MKKANFAPLQEMTADQIRFDRNREFNPSAWDAIIDRYSKYENATFYKEPANNINHYDVFYCLYTTHERINFFNKIGYYSSISNSGFTEIVIHDGNLYVAGVNGDVEQRAANTKNNRNTLALYSDSLGKIWSNEF